MKTVKEAGLTNWLRSHSSWVILGITILLAVALYAIVFWYQAGRPSREQAEQVWPAAGEAPCLIAGSAYTVELSLIYPQRLLYEPSAPSRPVSIRLQARTVPTESEEVEGWTVAFSWPDQGIVFTDQAGAEIAPRVVITPSVESVEPAVLYVRRSALPDVPDELSLTMRVYEPSNNVDPWSTDLPVIELESKAEAFWRRFWDMALGPATPLVGLGGGLIALVVKEWLDGRKREREQEQERSKAAKLAHIEALWDLRGNIVQAAREYVEIRRKVQEDPDWWDDELRKRLTEIWGRFSVQDLQDGAVRAWCEGNLTDASLLAKLAGDRERSELSSALLTVTGDQAVGEAITQACLVVHGVYAHHKTVGRKIDKVVADKFVDLLKDRLSLAAIERQLEQYPYAARLVKKTALEQVLVTKVSASEAVPDRQAAIRLLEAGFWQDWLQLWPKALRGVWPPLDYWLEQDSPLGPEEAEKDLCLPLYYVEGPILRKIWARQSHVLFAAPGSGRTAAAMLLAHFCSTDSAFPVFYVPPVSDQATNSGGKWYENPLLEMTRTTARFVARYLAYNSESFFELSQGQRCSLAHLLSIEFNSSDDLAKEMQRRGSVNRYLIGIFKELWPSSLRCNESYLLELLRDARPHSFDCFYWIVDSPSAQSDEYRKNLVRFLQVLLDLETRLAAEGVFIKLLLPTDLLPSLPLALEEVVVSSQWESDELQALLEQRCRDYPMLARELLSPVDVPVQLIAKAQGSPRALIRAVNEYFKKQGLGQHRLSTDQISLWGVYQHEQFDKRRYASEMEEILQCVKGAGGGQQVISIIGQAGVGKTWFLRELAWRLRDQQIACPYYLDLGRWRKLPSPELAVNPISEEIQKIRERCQLPLVLLVDGADNVPSEVIERLEAEVFLPLTQYRLLVIASRQGIPGRKWAAQDACQIRLKLPEKTNPPSLKVFRHAQAALWHLHPDLYLHLEAFSILRAFDDVRIGEVLKIRFPDEPWDYDACLEMRKRLLATKMVHWVKEKRGYVIDEPLRLLLEAALRQKDERLWRDLHCVAYRLYEKWAADFEQSRGDWLREREYHADVLKQHGYDPTHCQPLLETSE